ncbi:MAG: hypothetical protein RL367_1810, partial [Pseudomonadota bacterium]
MMEMADFAEDRSGDKPVLRFSGRLTLARVGDLPTRLGKRDMPPGVVDLSAVDRIDTVGAWLIYKLVRDHGTKVIGASAEAERLIEQVGQAGREGRIHPE